MKFDKQEHDFVFNYVLNHPLSRPNTTLTKCICYIILFLLFIVSLGVGFYFLLKNSNLISPALNELLNENVVLSIFIIILIIGSYACLILSPYILEGLIHLYQHYAKSERRRKCNFKPTCSEYALLAIKKYSFIIALIKIIHRVYFRCRGSICRIDYP